MSVLSALADGCRRALNAPALLFGWWLIAVVLPAPVGVDFSDSHLALIEASGIDPTPALLSVLGGRDMLLHAAAATFLLGGIMDRLARNRATATFGFFGAAGMYFFRFIRLAVVAVPVYMVVVLWIYPALPRGETVSYVVLAVLIVLSHTLFDFARVRMVVEDRRSAIGAIAAAFRFIRRNLGAAVGVSVINAAVACGTWWLAASFDIGPTAAVYAYLLARALLRLIFIASAVALFQGRLAHAGYMARPVATWPESAAAAQVASEAQGTQRNSQSRIG
jgi:hypothetical protein